MDMPATLLGAPISHIHGPAKVTGRTRVAAVAAETPDAAEDALWRLDVDDDVRPAVFDPRAAMRPEAPLLHDEVAADAGAPLTALATDVHHGQTRLTWAKGDVVEGFRQAEVMLEHAFAVPRRHQGSLEPLTSVLALDHDGRIQAWCASTAPFRARVPLAHALGLRDEHIRVHVVAVGGDFGGKGDARDLPVASLLATRAQRPVTIVLSSGAERTASHPTHPTVVTMRSGVTRDGRLTARAVRTVHASGAYGAMKPRSLLSTAHDVGGGYRGPHTAFACLQVSTNTTPGGDVRAPGAHPYTFALECHTDLLARALGLDPAAFRRLNLVGPGEADAVGRPLRVAAVRPVLDAALEAGRWGEPTAGPGRGKGVAIFGRQIGGGAAGAVLTAEADGTCTVRSPTVDVGTGTHTMAQQIVAAVMGVPRSWVRVRQGDTDRTPVDEGPRASRVTSTEGHAVLQACAHLRQALQAGGHPAPDHDRRARGPAARRRQVCQRASRGGRRGPGDRPGHGAQGGHRP